MTPLPRWIDDGALVRATLDGDSSARQRFAQRMVAIHRYLKARAVAAHNPHVRGLIDDVAQESVLRAWERRRSFDGSARLETWFVGIARIVLTEALRRRAQENRRRIELPEEGLDALEGGAEDAAEVVAERGQLARVLAALAELSERDRALVREKLQNGRTFAELAREQDCSMNTLKARYYRALRQVSATVGVPGQPH